MADGRTDAEIIAASLDEPDRFAAIFERHYQAIRRYTQQRAGVDAGEEIAARVFETAFTERRRFDARYQSAAPWLFGIATNLVRKHARAGGAHLRAIARLPRERSVEFDVDALLDRIDADRLRDAMLAALRALSPRDRDTILLVSWAGLTYEEASIALGVPIGTVRSRLNRARRVLRELMLAPEAMKDDG